MSTPFKTPVYVSDYNYICGADAELICHMAGATPEEVAEVVKRINAYQETPADLPTKTVWSCPHCGGFNVQQDASYDLNLDDYSLYDDMDCGDCGYDGHSFVETVVPSDFDVELDKLPEKT